MPPIKKDAFIFFNISASFKLPEYLLGGIESDQK